MRHAFALGLGLTLPLLAPGPAPDDPEPESLQGAYTIVRGEVDGEEAPKSGFEGHRVRITGDAIVATDKDGKEIYVAEYTLDADEAPWAIAMTESGGPKGGPGRKARGIIKRDEDGTVTLAYAVEGGTPPESFETEAGKGQNLFVLKRDSD
jgi:uncharacterized protein (TIGR03067 family)